MSEIVDIEPLMRGLYEEMQTGGENYSTQSVYEMIEKETSKVEVFTKADMVAMLEKIKDEITSNYLIDADTGKIISGTLPNFKAQKLLDSINNEIDKLKEDKE